MTSTSTKVDAFEALNEQELATVGGGAGLGSALLSLGFTIVGAIASVGYAIAEGIRSVFCAIFS